MTIVQEEAQQAARTQTICKPMLEWKWVIEHGEEIGGSRDSLRLFHHPVSCQAEASTQGVGVEQETQQAPCPKTNVCFFFPGPQMGFLVPLGRTYQP